MKEPLFSKYGKNSLLPSPVNEMMADFATDFRDGVDINLGVGYVNEQTIPADLIVDAMHHVARLPDIYRQAFNYGGPKGSPNLEGAIRRFYSRHAIGGLEEKHWENLDMAIGANGATSILEAVADILEPGVVFTADPMYYIYCNFLERKGFRVVTIPEDKDGLDSDALDARMMQLAASGEKIAFWYVVTVNNPSGTILTNERRRQLVALVEKWSACLSYSIPLFFDQAYEWLIHDPAVESPRSAFLWRQGGQIYEIGTLSKILAPALRIGFMLGPPGPLLRAVVQKTSDIGFSAPLMNQEIAAYLLDHHIAGQLQRVNAGYRGKARTVGDAVRECLSPWLEDCRGGSGGFCYYLTFKEICTDRTSPFFHFLSRTTGHAAIDASDGVLNPRVIYLPGEFCVHPKGNSAPLGKRQLRLSYGFEEAATIVRAVEYMREAARYAETASTGALQS